MLLQKKKRIAAMIMAVVLLITTANFVPSYTKANDDVATQTDAIIVDEASTEATTELVESTDTTEVTTEASTEEATTEEIQYDYSWMNEYTDEIFLEISGLTKEEWKVEYPDLTFDDFGMNMDTYAWINGTWSGDGELYDFKNGIKIRCHSTKYPAVATLESPGILNPAFTGNVVVCCTFNNPSPFEWTPEGANGINWWDVMGANTLRPYSRDIFFNLYQGAAPTYANGINIYNSRGEAQTQTTGFGALTKALTDNAGVTTSSAPYSSDFKITKANGSALSGEVDVTQNSTEQKTETFIANTGSSYIYANVSFPSGVTLHYVTADGSWNTIANNTNANKTQLVSNGKQFYFTAPLSRNSLDNISINATRVFGDSAYYIDEVILLVPSNTLDGETVQSFAVPRGATASRQLSVAWEGFGSIKVHKKPSDEAMANSISCYSDLSGAEFGVFKTHEEAKNATYETQNNNAVAIIVTDKNGEGSVTDIPMGTYYVKETKAPKNYIKSDQIYTVVVDSPSIPAEFNVINRLALDPLHIVVKKQDPNGKALAGAEFTIKYYDLQQDTSNPVDPATLGKSPIRTWVFRSDENGEVQFRNDPKYFVSGSEFWYNGMGIASIPIGTITIQETKAPNGYVIDPTVRVQSVRTDVDLDNEHYYNTSTIPNSEFKAFIKVVKLDKDTQKPIISNSAKFKIWSYKDNAYVSFNVNGVMVSEFETDSNGILYTPDTLSCGDYRIDEISCPLGYYSETTGGKTFTISTTGNYEQYVDEQGNVITDMGIYSFEIENKSVKGYIEINKKAENIVWNTALGKYVSVDVVKAGVKFDIYAEEDIYSADGQGTLVYANGDLVATITTDENGYARTELLELGKYRVKESVPVGYLSIDDMLVDLSLDSTLEENTENGIVTKLVYETLDIRNALQQAQIKVYKTDKDKIYYLEGAKYNLYEYDDTLITKADYIDKGVLVATGTTDKNGELIFGGYYSLGDYVAVEIEAPEGYVTDEQIHKISAEYDDSGVEYIYVGDSYINDSIKGSIRLIKKDMQDKGKTLEGVKFNLYKVVDDDTIPFAEDTIYSNSFKSLSADEKIKANSFKLNAEDMFIGEYVTDENGEIYIDNLCYGDYYFIETETLYRYNLNDTPQTFSIEENGAIYEMSVYNDGRVGKLTLWGYDSPNYDGNHPTGDNAPIMVVFLMAALSLIAIVCFVVLKRKKYGRY